MQKDGQDTFLSTVTNLVLLYIKRISDLANLVVLEAQLALRTLMLIAILLFMTASLLTVCWASLLTFLFFYLVSLQFSYLTASGIIFLINFFTLLGIAVVIYKIKNNLFFPATSKQLSKPTFNESDAQYEPTKTEN